MNSSIEQKYVLENEDSKLPFRKNRNWKFSLLYKAVTETLISFTLFKKSISSNLYRFSYEDWEVILIFFGDILILYTSLTSVF
jgi:hypothetical protein